MKKLLLLFIIFSLPFINGCAEMSQTLKDNELLSRIAIKDTTIIAIGESSKTDEGRKKSAQRLSNAVDQLTDYLDAVPGTGAINKEVIMDRFRSALGGADMPLYYKVVLDDLALILDEMYKPSIPSVEIPVQYKDDVKKVLGYVKEGTKLFL